MVDKSIKSKVSVHEDSHPDLWKKRCESLIGFCEAAAWSVDSEAVYQRIVDAGVNILDSDGAHLHLLTIDGKRFVRHASHADAQALADRESMFSVGVGRTKWMMRSRQPIFMDHLHPHCEDIVPKKAVELGFISAVSIPLLAGGEVLGMLSAEYKRELPWTEEDQSYLLDIGRVLGVLIQRVQMSKKEAELQILTERKRLSTEIHDNLSQLIGTLAINVDTALISYEEGDNEAVRTDLERLEGVTRRVMKVLREEMLSLRTPLEKDDGLLEGVVDCLARFEDQWNIETKLDIHVSEPISVSMQTALQLMRILNECLSNTLRHAEATCVHVTLEEDNRHMSFIIQDNGHGFDLSSVAPERLGIRIMHERAAATRGKLTVMSSEQGTIVCVDIPRFS